MKRYEALHFYDELLAGGDIDAIRWLGRNDRFFLHDYGLFTTPS